MHLFPGGSFRKYIRFCIVDNCYPKSFCHFWKLNFDFQYQFPQCISSFYGDIIVSNCNFCKINFLKQRLPSIQNKVFSKHPKNALWTCVTRKNFANTFHSNILSIIKCMLPLSDGVGIFCLAKGLSST